MNSRSILDALPLFRFPRPEALLPPARDAQPDIRADLARRTLRASQQTEVETARELCAESDAALSALAAAFSLQPEPATPRRWIHLARLAVATFIFSTLALAVSSGVGHVSSGAGLDDFITAVQAVAAMGLGGSVLLVAGLALAHGLRVPLWRTHQHLGLMLLPLDEHHPWLYLTPPLLHSELARKHKESVLRERGALRGLDLILMREYSRLDASLAELTAPHKVVVAVQR